MNLLEIYKIADIEDPNVFHTKINECINHCIRINTNYDMPIDERKRHLLVLKGLIIIVKHKYLIGKADSFTSSMINIFIDIGRLQREIEIQCNKFNIGYNQLNDKLLTEYISIEHIAEMIPLDDKLNYAIFTILYTAQIKKNIITDNDLINILNIPKKVLLDKLILFSQANAITIAINDTPHDKSSIIIITVAGEKYFEAYNKKEDY